MAKNKRASHSRDLQLIAQFKDPHHNNSFFTNFDFKVYLLVIFHKCVDFLKIDRCDIHIVQSSKISD